VSRTLGPSGGSYDFLIRRLHSLTGVIPVGIFLTMHLCTNSLVALSRGGVDYYQLSVNRFHALGPLLVPLEVFGILLPIAFHGLLGLKIWWESQPNVGRYPYWCNFRYTLQRITGVIVFAFILMHLWHMHWLGEHMPGDHGAMFDPKVATATAAYALQAKAWWTVPAYAIGIACACYHFATGLWTFMITWGITVGERSQDRMGYVCAGVGAILLVIGITAQVALMTWPTPAPRTEPLSVHTTTDVEALRGLKEEAPRGLKPAALSINRDETHPGVMTQFAPKGHWNVARDDVRRRRTESLGLCRHQFPRPGWGGGRPDVRFFRPCRGGVGIMVWLAVQGFRFAPPLATFDRPFGAKQAEIIIPPAQRWQDTMWGRPTAEARGSLGQQRVGPGPSLNVSR